MMENKTYEVIRFFKDTGDRETIKTGLSREEAREHCQDPETSYLTCEEAEGVSRTEKHGPWFDGFEEE